MIRIAPAVASMLLVPALVNAQPQEMAAPQGQPADAEAMIAEAVKAAPPAITEGATLVDWEGNVLREGDNGWTCLPSPPGMTDAPMCLDQPWVQWAEAWQAREAPAIDAVGIAYMMVGDAGSSNVDPYATGPTADNEWVVAGPHLMLIVPDVAQLDALPTDPDNGGPWVMWKGTPYAHVMVPIGDEPTR